MMNINDVSIMNEELSDVLLSDVLITYSNEVKIKHGKHALQRYQRLLINKENSEGRKLTDTEIFNLYNEFDAELCRTVMTRQGE